MRRIFGLIVLCVISAVQVVAQVNFQTELKKGKGAEAEIVFRGTIDAGWHVYSTQLGQGGPTSATFHLDQKDGVELVGGLQALGKEKNEFDPVFNMNLRFFENNVRFVQKIRFVKSTYLLKGYLEYGACNERMCMPPTAVDVEYQGEIPVVKEAALSAQEETVVDTLEHASIGQSVDTLSDRNIYTPVIQELKAYDSMASVQDMSWLYIFLQGLLWGFIALLTPCVWPIIPMTVSFFLHRHQEEKRKAVQEAMTYGLSIIVIYVGLGLLVTLLFGANALNALSTNAYFNIFLFLLLVVLAASFLGAFELTLPASWSNKVDAKSSRTTGWLSIFLMAFTLSLVSFSCTGPIIGFLLVGVASSGNMVAPAIGMFGFALALALPFTLFAIFPSWLKSVPKSGGWMNVIKVTLAFVELAFALKFLSVADLAYGWRLLDREIFIALWIALFGILGIYLLGIIKFKHDDENRKIGAFRFFLALISIAFTVYMIPGLWGAPLKGISAFTPPMYTQSFNLYHHEVMPKFKDYETGMAYAREMGKPVMIDFTGYGCVNCRKMEASVWTDTKVADLLNQDYVLISLYVDDKTPLPEQQTVTVNGKKRTLRTIGDKWSYLQQVKFGSNAQPFYVLLDNDGKPLNRSYAYDEDVDQYVEFLRKGLENFGKVKR